MVRNIAPASSDIIFPSSLRL